MLSKNQIKSVTALRQKKFRKEEGLFVAEGEKVVTDLLGSKLIITGIYCTDEFIHRLSPYRDSHQDMEIHIVKANEMERISSLDSPQPVLAVAKIPENKLDPVLLKDSLSMVLDDIRDPGNVGTMFRIAEWFGLNNIICSPGTVDFYNPKVVQAAMGSLFRVRPVTMDLPDFFRMNQESIKLPVFGTLMKGENIFDAKLSPKGLLVFGNESAGINSELLPFIDRKITIPSFQNKGADSLNVSVAAGIVCAEFIRRIG